MVPSGQTTPIRGLTKIGSPNSRHSRNARWPRFLSTTIAAGVMLLTGFAHARAEPLFIKIIGGLGGVTQYTKLEEPFWNSEIETLTNGRIRASIHAFDRAGLPSGEMLRLIQTGVVPFGTAPLQISMGEAPEFGALDLATMNPDMATLKRSTEAFRPYLTTRLRQHYNIELLGIYSYPAQVVFCAKPFAGLEDLAGRRIRTSSAIQSETVTALGGHPVKTPFSEVVSAVRKGVVECAITGTMSGNEIGLSEVTTHVHATAISWGLSLFAVNRDVWQDMAPDDQALVRKAVGILEARIWQSAERETANGLACNAGEASCIGGKPGKMTVVSSTASEKATLRKLALKVALPGWLDRCGNDCIDIWNQTLAAPVGITIRPDRSLQVLAKD